MKGLRNFQGETKTRYVQQGMSLVELLVALALGAFLMAGLIQVFFANQQTSMLQEDFGRVQEGGRIGLEMLVKDARMADFRGCMSASATINNMLDLTDTDYDASVMNFTGGGVEGADNVTAVTIGGQSVIDGSDTLTLRGSVDACAGNGQLDTTNIGNANMLVDVECNIAEGDVLLLSDCSSGELFSVSSWNPNNPVLVHNTGNITEPGAIDNATQAFSREYTTGDILRPYQKTYFIAPGTNGTSLWVNDTGASMELVTGVDGFQVVYGEDTDGDNSVDLYSDSDLVSDMEDVKSLRLTLSMAEGDVAKDYRAIANIRNRMQ